MPGYGDSEPAVWQAPDTNRVVVSRLDLTNFRTYASARIETGGSPVVLTGPNGSGKTNLLEALSFLAPGRGLRRARLAEIDRQGAEAPWAVAARLHGPEGEVTIGTGRESGPDAGDRRVVRIDGQGVKGQAALARHLNLVWLTPQMDRLFQEGAAPRRRFLDRLVFGFDADHAHRLAAYDLALRTRARLLREGSRDAKWLSLLEETMARDGIAIAAARLDIVQRLDEAAAALADAAFPVPGLGLLCETEALLARMPAVEAEAALAGALAAGRRLDAETGGASAGPHRADFAVRHRAKDRPAPECSTGEQKALLIAIVLAHARLQASLRGVLPILLLDEVAAHLDRSRRRALFDGLRDLGGQAWLTGSDPEAFEDLRHDAHFFVVSEGRVMPAGPV